MRSTISVEKQVVFAPMISPSLTRNGEFGRLNKSLGNLASLFGLDTTGARRFNPWPEIGQSITSTVLVM